MVIEEFIDYYLENKAVYETVKERVHNTLKKELNDAGIMAIVSSRVKDKISLKDKLFERNNRENYIDFEHIIQDIVDLVGVRIALYFPSDSKKISTLINRRFILEKEKIFPNEQQVNSEYARRFPGYCATHYRIYLNDDDLAPNIKDVRVEIQVASLLMHAWSEVEHDLTYKKKRGNITFDEYESLDEINGLVIAGELSLQRLQRITESRIIAENKPFENHYQLASFIYDELSLKNKKDVNVGDVDVLFKYFSKKKRLTPRKIKNDLSKIKFNFKESIVSQIIDKYINSSEIDSKYVVNENNKKIIDTRFNTASPEMLFKFIERWFILDKMISKLSKNSKINIDNINESINKLLKLNNKNYIKSDWLDKYGLLRGVRNQIIYSNKLPNEESMKSYLKEINNLIVKLEELNNKM